MFAYFFKAIFKAFGDFPVSTRVRVVHTGGKYLFFDWFSLAKVKFGVPLVHQCEP